MNKTLINQIDHIDIVTTHMCNMACPFCIDKFVKTCNRVIDTADVMAFLTAIKDHAPKDTEVLLLGGEPTTIPLANLEAITTAIRACGFSPIMSTNGKLRNKIIQSLPFFDWVQVTMHDDAEIEFYRGHDNINAKLSGDGDLTLERLEDFIIKTADFGRVSLSMYFTPEYENLCEDERVWALLDTLEWELNGSYEYAFYKGMRIKRCIPNFTNQADEPTVPKLYPNGNYNQTWNDENLDDYLQIRG